MNETLALSAAGEALIKSFEQCAQLGADGNYHPYHCPAGVLTIGWGHTNAQGRPFAQGAVWSRSDCDAAFDEDMATFGAGVKAIIHVPLAQGQYDALVSFAYNCGLGNLKSSTLLKMVNASDFADAAGQFQRWDRCNGQPLPGLLRREAEAQLFAGAAPAPAGTVDPAVRVVDAPAD